MTELLITVMNLPRNAQRMIAFTLLALVVVVFAALALSLWSVISTKHSSIEDLRGELYRLEQAISRQPAEALTIFDDPPDLFLEGDSIAVLQAKLQERVSLVAAASGATIASMSGTSQMQVVGAAYVGLRVDLEGSLVAIHGVIRQLETSMPPLIIPKAAIRSNNMFAQGKLDGPILLSAQITIYSAVRPELATVASRATP